MNCLIAKRLLWNILCCGIILLYTPRTLADDSIRADYVKTAVSIFTGTPPVIDGDISDEVWNKANTHSGFHRRNDPGKGETARVDTSFRILNDEKYLYVAVKLHDMDPGKLLKSITRRDNDLDQDDFVCLYLDTFRDMRSAYFFQVNPLGTQRDIYSTGNGTQVDLGWDGIWDAATRITDYGWSAEFRIPFKILRFNWSSRISFGFDMVRSSSQREEFSEWCYIPNNQNSSLDPTLYGVLDGLEGVLKPRMLQCIGSAVASRSRINRTADPYSDETGWARTEDADAGLDVIWGMTPTLTLNVTLNPDFAQIEADADQINLTGEEIFLEERRPFFRENNAIFRVPDGLHPFYSRRIVTIDEGLKLTGQAAGSDLAALIVRGEDGAERNRLFTVLRTQTPLVEGMTISGWLVGNINRDTLHDYVNPHGELIDRVNNDRNLLFGLDGRYQFDNWRLYMHAYYTEYPEEMRPWYSNEPDSDKHLLWFSVGYTGNNWSSKGHLMDHGMGYHPETGFTDVSRLGNRSYNQYYWREIPFAENHPLNSIEFYAEWEFAFDRNDMSNQTCMEVEGEFEIEFNNHVEIKLRGEWADDRTYEKFAAFPRDDNGDYINSTAGYFAETLGNGDHHVQLGEVHLDWSDGGWQGTGIKYIFGKHFYSDLTQISAWGNWKPTDQLSLEASVDYLKRSNPTDTYIEKHRDWEDQSTWIFRSKLMYYFTKDLYLRAIASGYLDKRWIDDRYDLSLLIAYEYLPGSHVYAVYQNQWIPYDRITQMHLGLDEMQRKEETLYLKITYMLDL
jgi:Domain of unknown function (DUF5916)/Carbohydrate family 9 binding domain-like